MSTGLEAVRKALKGSGSGSGGGSASGRYLSYFILGDGDSKVVRFLTDFPDLAVENFYEFIKDRNGKFQNFVHAPHYNRKNPDWQGEDWVKKFGGKTTDYTTKELVDPTPRERIVGLAVEREEFASEENGRRIVRTQDKLSQFEGKDGKTYDARNFLIVKQHPRFWTMLDNYFSEYGTICDRDYKITRNGTGRDIVYSILPKAPDPDWNNDGSSLAALRAQYGYGTGKDMDGNELTAESEDRFLYCGQTLTSWLDNQASEERAKAALLGEDEARPAPGWSPPAADEPTAAPAAANTDVSSLRARLERHR